MKPTSAKPKIPSSELLKAKNRVARQRAFLDACTTTSQTLDEIMEEQGVSAATFSRWLDERDFRVKLHAMQRRLRRQRELQIQVGAVRGAAMLTQIVYRVGTVPQPIVRAASVDLVRLARDSRARRRAENANPDEGKFRALYHPELAPDEAHALAVELMRADAPPAPDAPPQQEPV